MHFNLIFLALISGIILINETPKAQTMTKQPVPAAETLYNQSYGSDPAQKMDIYLPAAKNDSTIMMVIVHGGAWVRGDKSEFNPYVSALRTLLPGYAFANVNYRLFRNGVNKFPAQEQDMRAATSYLASRLSEFGLSHKMVLLGASAGAHLVLLQAYKNKGQTDIKAVISFFGPTDMNDMYKNSKNPDVKPMLTSLLGGTPRSQAELYKSSSPVAYVSADAPPTLILQGGRDRMVHQEQAQILKRKLDEMKVINELRLYPEEGHGWYGAPLYDSFARVAAFLKKHAR
jgi:acetyl esterase/lipase